MNTITARLFAAFIFVLTAAGAHAQGVPAEVEIIPGGPDAHKHLAEGETHDYGTPFPTSGPHSPHWTKNGFYGEVQPPVQLVHALEHGNIVIYYDKPSQTVLSRLHKWAETYTGQWDGIIVTPSPGLGTGIVLTAWERRLILPRYDKTKVYAFIDAFRGRGPEHPVR
jgi:uncharacterized protein DUF3105